MPDKNSKTEIKKAALLAAKLAAESGSPFFAVLVIGGFLIIFFLVLFFMFGSSLAAAVDIRGGFRSGAPSAEATAEIPPEWMPALQAAQEKYGVSWAVLAAIARVESDFGRSGDYLKRGGVSDAGAVGPMQFMPTTWSGSRNPYARDDPHNPTYDTDPERIARYGGYGVDADHDGKADPYDVWDAVFAAASYLKANGFEKNPRDAVYAYNHAWWYVERVLSKAQEYSEQMLPVAPCQGWPLPPAYTAITSRFGPRVHPVTGEPGFHEGIDLACPIGTPVYSVLPGRVVFAGWKGAYGNAVVIQHGGATETLYGHLSQILVRVGDEVAAGRQVGLSGNTGSSTGAHLHFGLYVNGRPSDPELWLKAPAKNY